MRSEMLYLRIRNLLWKRKRSFYPLPTTSPLNKGFIKCVCFWKKSAMMLRWWAGSAGKAGLLTSVHIKPNGYILLNVPALNILYSRYDQVVGHHRRYTKASLSQELLKSDLEILDMAYWGFLLVPFLLVRKLTISIYRDTSKVVQFGFKPPSPAFNRMFLKLMRLENKFIPKPLLGTSLLTAVKKKSC